MNNPMDGISPGYHPDVTPRPACVICDVAFKPGDRIVPTYYVEDVRNRRVRINSQPSSFAHLDCLASEARS